MAMPAGQDGGDFHLAGRRRCPRVGRRDPGEVGHDGRIRLKAATLAQRPPDEFHMGECILLRCSSSAGGDGPLSSDGFRCKSRFESVRSTPQHKETPVAIKDRTGCEEPKAVDGWAVTRVSDECFEELLVALETEPTALPALQAAAKESREKPAFYRS